ncbi:MAG: tRNA (mo5U34)-methyltransferase [Syntrophorhabdus sp. PtaB.Bin027]|nr:MAG: tRNA (mo5U34)-methyltransferase [Syntrophorhabdus sp. PtaB.Bin027]
MKDLLNPRTFARSVYYYSPELLRKIFWKVYLFYIRNRILLKNPKYDFKMVHVDPNSINLIRKCSSLGAKFRNIGSIKSGDWDIKEVTKFEDSNHFKAMKDHFLQDVPFLETSYYKKILNEIEHGEILWGCHNKDELMIRFNDLEKLYESMRDQGYKTQKHIGNAAYLDEITINIGRNGELIFEEGFHRLAIAKILKLKNIPVIITQRHSEWVKFRNEISSYAVSKDEGRIYQPLEHPDLSDLPNKYSDHRWNIISQNLLLSSGMVLDIGSQWGYFSRKFEQAGFTCVAVENNPTELYFLERLKIIHKMNFSIISKSIFDIDEKKFDIVLALNIFHHFLKTKNEFFKLKAFLESLDTTYLFFEPHDPLEDQMKMSFINFNNEEFVNFILSNSCLNHSKYIGNDEGRNIYILYK